MFKIDDKVISTEFGIGVVIDTKAHYSSLDKTPIAVVFNNDGIKRYFTTEGKFFSDSLPSDSTNYDIFPYDEEKTFNVGDKVICYEYGIGKIYKKGHNNDYPLWVNFNGLGDYAFFYTKNGCFYKDKSDYARDISKVRKYQEKIEETIIFKEGDRVVSEVFGTGTIIEISEIRQLFPILVKFDESLFGFSCPKELFYNKDGCLFADNIRDKKTDITLVKENV